MQGIYENHELGPRVLPGIDASQGRFAQVRAVSLGPVTRKGDAVPVPFDVVSQAQRFEPFISLAD